MPSTIDLITQLRAQVEADHVAAPTDHNTAIGLRLRQAADLVIERDKQLLERAKRLAAKP